MDPRLKTAILLLGAGGVWYGAAMVPRERYDRAVVEAIRSLDVQIVDREAGDFALSSLDATVVRLSDFRGQVVFLNFWASWCRPCREELPSMVGLAQSLRGSNVAVIAVSLDEDEATLRSFLGESGVPVDAFLILRDPSGDVAKQWGTELLPETYLVDAEGWVVARFPNAWDWSLPEIRELISRVERGRWRGDGAGRRG